MLFIDGLFKVKTYLIKCIEFGIIEIWRPLWHPTVERRLYLLCHRGCGTSAAPPLRASPAPRPSLKGPRPPAPGGPSAAR